MEIGKALELLRQYKDEIAHLRTLRHSNNEHRLWADKVNVVLADTFERNSYERNVFDSHRAFAGWSPMTEEDRQENYLNGLDECELAITKILQKYEIIGTPSAPETGQVQAPKDSTQKPNKGIFNSAIEINLRGTPDILRPIVKSVARELKFQGWGYSAKEEIKSVTSTFVKFLIETGKEENEGFIYDNIGILTLQLLPDNHTLLRVPPRRLWDFTTHDTAESIGLVQGIYTSSGDFNLNAGYEIFDHFLTSLSTKFQSLGLKETRRMRFVGWVKTNRWLRALVITIVGGIIATLILVTCGII